MSRLRNRGWTMSRLRNRGRTMSRLRNRGRTMSRLHTRGRTMSRLHSRDRTMSRLLTAEFIEFIIDLCHHCGQQICHQCIGYTSILGGGWPSGVGASVVPGAVVSAIFGRPCADGFGMFWKYIYIYMLLPTGRMQINNMPTENLVFVTPPYL